MSGSEGRKPGESSSDESSSYPRSRPFDLTFDPALDDEEAKEEEEDEDDVRVRVVLASPSWPFCRFRFGPGPSEARDSEDCVVGREVEENLEVEGIGGVVSDSSDSSQ